MRWILLALALIVGVAQSQQEPPKPKASNHKSNAEQRGSEQSPLFVKTPGPTTQADRDYETYEKNQKPWNETAIAYATIALGTITLGLAIFTALLWNATRKLVAEGQNTARHELRAYISCVSGNMSLIADTALRAEVEFRNTGRTPAHNVRLAITGAISPASQIPEFVDPEFVPHRQPIAPNAHWTVGHEFHGLTKDDIQDVVSDKKLVYVWGRAEYTDIFTQPRSLRFRYRNVVKQLAIDPNTGQRGISGWAFYPEENGNEAT